MDNQLNQKTYSIIGLCMEVHKILGHGFSEILYKDAIMIESDIRNVPFQREKEFAIGYKRNILKHSYFADFVFFDNVIVEVKAAENAINSASISQTLNYLKVSGSKVGLIINFGRQSLEYKRLLF